MVFLEIGDYVLEEIRNRENGKNRKKESLVLVVIKDAIVMDDFKRNTSVILVLNVCIMGEIESIHSTLLTLRSVEQPLPGKRVPNYFFQFFQADACVIFIRTTCKRKIFNSN